MAQAAVQRLNPNLPLSIAMAQSVSEHIVISAKERIKKYFDRVRGGLSLSEVELSEVRRLLISDNEQIQASSIHLLGYVEDTKSREEILRILNQTKNSIVASEAIWTISRQFDSPQIVRSFIMRILLNRDDELEDILGDLRRRAIKIAGDIIVESPKDTELIRELLNVFENERELRMHRDQAYRSLARLNGKNYDGLEYSTRHLPEGEFDLDFLARLKKNLHVQEQ